MLVTTEQLFIINLISITEIKLKGETTSIIINISPGNHHLWQTEALYVICSYTQESIRKTYSFQEHFQMEPKKKIQKKSRNSRTSLDLSLMTELLSNIVCFPNYFNYTFRFMEFPKLD